MKTYTATMYFRNIPIWNEILRSRIEPPTNLCQLNDELGMFGDKLIIQRVMSETIKEKLKDRMFSFN